MGSDPEVSIRQAWSTAALALLLSARLQAEPVNLIFVGDLMLDDSPGRLITAGGDPLEPFSALLKEADYRIGNLECPIGEGGDAFISLRRNRSLVRG